MDVLSEHLFYREEDLLLYDGNTNKVRGLRREVSGWLSLKTRNGTEFLTEDGYKPEDSNASKKAEVCG